MRILVVGATGTIGRAVVQRLASRHEIVAASHSKSAVTVDISRPESIQAMYRAVGTVDAVVSVAGKAKFLPLEKLSDADYQFCLENKLMGQVNLVRLGLAHVRDGGSFWDRMGKVACWNTLMDENQYMVKKWNEFLAS